MKKSIILSVLLICNIANCSDIGDWYSGIVRSSRDCIEYVLPAVFSENAHRSEFLTFSILISISLLLRDQRQAKMQRELDNLKAQLEKEKQQQRTS
jgi:hypothetical protein